MSPFEIFRRNLKPAMVVLTLLSLFAFVVLPAVDGYLRRGTPGATDPVVGNIGGKEIKRSRVEYFTRNHNTTVRFLYALAQETIDRGGAPVSQSLFQYDPRSQQVTGIGIEQRSNDFISARTMQLAGEAEKAGLTLDDQSLRNWLREFTDNKIDESEINGFLSEQSNNKMGMFHLYEQLRSHLLAGLYQRGGSAGIVTERQMPINTPAQQWTNFLKLNRKATVDAYGVLVADFVEETDANPPESEIKAVYEAGKSRFSESQSVQPGFRRRPTASFEYVYADIQKFYDREVAKLNEDDIRAEYDKRVKGGAFAVPENRIDEMLKEAAAAEAEKESLESKDADAKAADTTSAETEDKPDAKADAEAKADDKKMDAEAKAGDVAIPPAKTDGKETDGKETDDKAKAGAVTVPPAKADDKKMDAKAAFDKEAAAIEKRRVEAEAAASKKNAAANKKQVEDLKSQIDAVREEAKKAAEEAADDQSSLLNDNGVRLVVFQDEDNPDAKADDAKTDDAKADDAKQDGDAKDAEKPVEPKAKADSPDEADAQPKSGDEGEPKSGESTSDDDKEDDDGKPKVESYEDVRKQVAESMVDAEVNKQVDVALQAAYKSMEHYFFKRTQYDTAKEIGGDYEEPKRPNLKEFAKQQGLEYGSLPMQDALALGKQDIANSFIKGQSPGRPGPGFGAMMFGSPQQGIENGKEVFFPLRTSDPNTRKFYVTWKTDEKEAYEPELDECREEVIQSIRMGQARELAQAKAKELATELAKGKTFDEVVPEDKKFNLHKDLGPFSWMQSFGFRGAFMGNVPELDSVGEEFMGKVFSTNVGEYGVASNLPERVVYVVKPTAFSPATEDLHDIFKQPGERAMTMLLGNEDAGAIYQGFFESIDERTGFTFNTEQ